jgi:hypothetical protein
LVLPQSPNARVRRRRAFVIALAIVTVGVLAGIVLTRGGGIAGKKDLPTPQLVFASSVEPVSGGSKTAPQGKVKDESGAIVTLFTEWYQEAFVDPKKWGDGTFADLAGHFTADAKAAFNRDKAALTIAEARTELKRVDSPLGSVKVTVYFHDGNPQYAVADVTFKAVGTMKRKGVPPLQISQRGSYFLRKVDGGWKIFSFKAHEEQVQPSPTPTASPTR